MMAFFHIQIAVFLKLTLLCPCLCEGSVEVVVTTPESLQTQIRSEIKSALSEFTCHTAPSTPQQGACSCEEDSAGSHARNVTEMVIRTIDAISDKLDILQQRLDILFPPGSTYNYPASSCAEILEEYPDSPSGYYWVRNMQDQTHRVYCDMTRSCGGVTGGWMRVAYLDMTKSSHQCPSSLYQRTDSGVRSCAVKTSAGSCSSVWYLPQGIPYSRVCGRVLGYFVSSADGFQWRPASPSINSIYVDGVSLTYGKTNRQHIWTFASTYVESGNSNCQCGTPPSFVNSHYFCDAHQVWTTNFNNPLWDGKGCGGRSCCHLHNPPWFYRHLPHTTTEDIEMRLCRDQVRSNEDVAIKAAEIYIK